MFSKLRLFSGNSNPILAQKVAQESGIPLSNADIFKFSNDDTFVRIKDNVRGSDVFVIQSTCAPVNDNLMELLIIIDALRRASAERITAVIPYYGYARSDKKDQPRVPITAKLVANLLTTAGADRIVNLDLHAGQIQGFFDIPVDHLTALPILLDYYSKMKWKNLVIVSPDSGGVKRARKFATNLKADLAVGDKRRTDNSGNSSIINIIGNVKGCDTILVDDIVDTATSITNIAYKLKELGANKIYATCTHAVLSDNAVKKIQESPITEFVVTDSIPLTKEKKMCKKFKQLTIANLLAKAIKKIHLEESISMLFD
ncbi:MAG: ribose-phosphate diphosphokinase [Candidatus Cloacimonadota bacterium]|nr:MAG: ribose-phosphate diphosphokinase [Candidatus Cloacimonadota bacterium]